MGYVGMSDYLLNALLKHVHMEAAYTAPVVNYLAAFVGNPLSGGVEASGGSYARQAVTWAGVTAGSNEYTDDNTGEIAFPKATAGWGIITHLATYDADVAGNLLEVFELETSRNAVAGVVLKVASGNLDSHLKREMI